MRTKSQSTWHLYKQLLYKVIKFMKITSNSTQNRYKKQKSWKDEKLVFRKYRSKNTIEEIMNTQVYWVKWDSPAP